MRLKLFNIVPKKLPLFLQRSGLATLSLMMIPILFVAFGCNQKAVEQKASEISPADTSSPNKDDQDTPEKLQSAPPKPISIMVTPSLTTVAVGTSVRLSALAIYPYGIVKDITEVTSWSIDNHDFGTFRSFDPPNSLLTLAPGVINVTGTYKDIVGSVTLTVSTAKVVKLTPYPAAIESSGLMISGTFTHDPISFKILGTLSDGRIQDMTNDVQLTTGSPKILLSSTSVGSVSLTGPVESEINITFEGLTAKLPVKATQALPVPKFLTVSPSPAVLAKGEVLPLSVFCTYTDNTVVDISMDPETIWVSSAPSSIVVDIEAGKPTTIKAAASGQFTLTAKYRAIEQSIDIVSTIANLVEIKVSPGSLQLPKGSSANYTATGIYSDNTPEAPSRVDLTNAVVWSTNKPSIANFSGNTLTASPSNMGNLTVTASFKNKSGTTAMDVVDGILKSIAISPSSGSLAVGKKMQFSAVGTYTDSRPVADLSSAVTWAAYPNGYFSVDTKGLITAIQSTSGLTLKYAELEAKQGSISKRIPITVTPKTIESIELNSATGEPGDTTTSKTAPIGLERQMQIIATYSDGSKSDVTSQTSWTFDILSPGYSFAGYVLNSGVDKGKIKGVAIGTTKITATIDTFSISFDFVVTKKRIKSLVSTNSIDAEMVMGDFRQIQAKLIYTDDSEKDLSQIFSDTTLTRQFIVSPSDYGTPHVSISSAGLSLGTISTLRESSGSIALSVYETDTPTIVGYVAWPLGVSSRCDFGTRYDRYCWYAADFGQSCSDKCASVNANYHAATSFFAGSQSNFAYNCGNLLKTLMGGSNTLSNTSGNATSADGGLGCGRTSSSGFTVNFRVTTPQTDADASEATSRRVCACDR